MQWLCLQLNLAHAATPWTDSDGNFLQHLPFQSETLDMIGNLPPPGLEGLQAAWFVVFKALCHLAPLYPTLLLVIMIEDHEDIEDEGS